MVHYCVEFYFVYPVFVGSHANHRIDHNLVVLPHRSTHVLTFVLSQIIQSHRATKRPVLSNLFLKERCKHGAHVCNCIQRMPTNALLNIFVGLFAQRVYSRELDRTIHVLEARLAPSQR